MNLILYAIPFFFLLIFMELAYGLWIGKNTYRLNDTINSLSMGSLSRLQGLVILGFSGIIYEWVVANYQLAQLPDNDVSVWLSCFVLYDLAYYWKHRLGHEVALFWGSHVSHHQSEDYNLGTALRQTSIDFHGFLFYLPFFLIGYPAEILFTVASLNLIYQFWVHTEHVPKLGVFEWVFVTPSNHRVHHARNTDYVDKNYGGVFILWDRLFGSFQEELDSQPVVFGLRKPLNSFNPLWANVHVYWRLILDTLKAPGIRNKLRQLLKPPGWQPEGQVSSCKNAKNSADLNQKYNPKTSVFIRNYTFVQFLHTTIINLYVLVFSSSIDYSALVFSVLALAFSLYGFGALLENSKHSFKLEVIRLGALTAVSGMLFSNLTVNALAVLFMLLSLAFLLRHLQNPQQKYNETQA